MRFLLDHNVPVSVAEILRERPHDVVLVSEILAPDSPDPIVAKAAMAENRVLVSHDKDMKRVEKLVSNGQREKFPELNRLHLSCDEVVSAARIASFIDIIEAEFAFLLARGLPMVLDIGDRRARLIR